jgi:hypothetical protein
MKIWGAMAISIACLVAGCKPIDRYKPDTAVAPDRSAGDGAIGDRSVGDDANGDSVTEPSDAPADAPASDLGTDSCAPGFHVCDGACVDSSLVAHCGARCEPCPDVFGGTPTCDGARCNGVCPPGKRRCLNTCIDEATVCEEKCSPEQQPCKPPPNADATCNGSACDFTCHIAFCRRGLACLDSMNPDSCGATCETCPQRENATATCNGTTCGSRCNPGFRDCDGVCKPADTVDACGSKCAKCGKCQECASGACRNQDRGQDKQEQCPASACRSGVCDGQGECEVKSGNSCVNGDLLSCPSGSTTSCNGFGCSGNSCNDCSTPMCDGSVFRPCNGGKLGAAQNCGGRGCDPSSRSCCIEGTRWNGQRCEPDCVPDQPCGGPDTTCVIDRTVCTNGVRSCQPKFFAGNCGDGPTCTGLVAKTQDTCQEGLCVRGERTTCTNGCFKGVCNPDSCGEPGATCCPDKSCKTKSPDSYVCSPQDICVKCGGHGLPCCSVVPGIGFCHEGVSDCDQTRSPPMCVLNCGINGKKCCNLEDPAFAYCLDREVQGSMKTDCPASLTCP